MLLLNSFDFSLVDFVKLVVILIVSGREVLEGHLFLLAQELPLPRDFICDLLVSQVWLLLFELVPAVLAEEAEGTEVLAGLRLVFQHVLPPLV